MKNMKKLLALALVIVSVLAISIPALAGTQVSAIWVDATAVGDLGGVVSCIYSRESESSAYIVQAFQNATAIQVKFDRSNLNWASAKYGNVTGYIPTHHFDVTTDNLRKGLFSGYTLSQGFQGKPVENLQRCLDALGYNTNGIDGIYGSGTKEAVFSFQKKFADLTNDGVAGKNTKLKIISECQWRGIIE